jgi:hypothetical protein
MSHERMLKAEAQLEKEIKELMRKAEILDAQEDSKYGKGKLGSDLPKELHRRQDRLVKDLPGPQGAGGGSGGGRSP